MSNVVTLKAEDLGNQIVREAGRFVGLREVRPNADWDNPKTSGPDAALVLELKTLMRPSPWEEGWSYCAAFAEAMVRCALIRLAVTPAEAAKFLDVMSPGVLLSYNRFKERKLINPNPCVGALWLARHGSTERGHAGIVTSKSLAGMNISTIEGNTSLDSKDLAKDREGDWITPRTFPATGRGDLRTLGFVQPDAMLKLIFG
ncbi:hypothetical protein [Prosthecobacter sp.]|uniref:hypothetical protein n=1 Tax=Prosthecobacter sp. TaxID=1965333 RepID=UPI003783824F